MGIYYSASAPGFFDSAIHSTLPDDAIEISPARHRVLLAAQGDGATIEPNDAGKPVIRRVTVTVADMRTALVRRVKREAARRIDIIAPLWRQLNDLRGGGDRAAAAARAAAIDAVRTASDAIEADIADASSAALAAMDVASHPLWPQE